MSANTALAFLNGALCMAAVVFGGRGFAAIRRGERAAHGRAMTAAFTFAALFMVGFVARYVLYGARQVALAPSWARAFFVFLAIHEAISVITIPLVTATFVLGLSRRVSMHREVAPWSFLVWMLASGTGLGVFFLLYVWPGHT